MFQTASVLQTGGNWAATAEKYGMVVALPDAPNGGVVHNTLNARDIRGHRREPVAVVAHGVAKGDGLLSARCDTGPGTGVGAARA